MSESSSSDRVIRYSMFGLLYFSQGTILSYFTALNALYFRSKGLSMADVGVFASIALIPFVVKIGFGMFSDRINLFGLGHRKPYILLGLAIQTLCLIAAPFIDPAKAYWGFVALAFVLQMGMALYDTCTDGLALDTIPEHEQGTIQSFMVGGRAFGVVITATIVGLLAQQVSWAAVFWLLAVFTLLPVPLVLRIQEAARPVARAFQWSAFTAFKEKRVLALTAIGLLFFLIIAGANQNVNPFLQDEFAIDLSTAGLVTTVWGVGAVLGGWLGGVLIDRAGHARAVLVALGISFMALLGLALVHEMILAWPMSALFGLSYGAYQSVYYALAMNVTDRRIAASMFSILMATSNVAQGIGMALSGALAGSDSLGFRWTFVLLGLLNLLVLPFLPVLFSRRQPPSPTL